MVGDACQYSDIKNTFVNIPNNSIIFSAISSNNSLTGNHNIIKSAKMLKIKRLLLVTSVSGGAECKYLSSKAKALFGIAIRHKSIGNSYLKNQFIKLYHPSACRAACFTCYS